MIWKKEITEPGFYYWQGNKMTHEHVIVIQVSEYKYPKEAPGRLHVEMLLPVLGCAYDYSYEGPIEKMPKGRWWGPLPRP